jgi:hypothetical protein
VLPISRALEAPVQIDLWRADLASSVIELSAHGKVVPVELDAVDEVRPALVAGQWSAAA